MICIVFCYFTLYKLRDFFFVMRSPCTTLLREVRLRLGSKNESFLHFHFVLRSPCTTLLREVRLRFGSKNESFLHFRFVLRSPCTNFALIYKKESHTCLKI